MESVEDCIVDIIFQYSTNIFVSNMPGHNVRCQRYDKKENSILAFMGLK